MLRIVMEKIRRTVHWKRGQVVSNVLFGHIDVTVLVGDGSFVRHISISLAWGVAIFLIGLNIEVLKVLLPCLDLFHLGLEGRLRIRQAGRESIFAREAEVVIGFVAMLTRVGTGHKSLYDFHCRTQRRWWLAMQHKAWVVR
jgi:hypothetical protein